MGQGDPIIAVSGNWMGAIFTAVSVLQMGLVAVAVGFGAAFSSRLAMAGAGRIRWTPLWLVSWSLVGATWWVLVAPVDLSGYPVARSILPSLGRSVSVLLILMAVMFPAAAGWDRLKHLGRRAAVHAVLTLLPSTGVCVVLAWLTWFATAALHRRGAVDMSVPFLLAGTVVVILAGINAGGVARALTDRGLDRLASMVVAAIPTAIAAVVGFPLLFLTDPNWRYAPRSPMVPDHASPLIRFGLWCGFYFVAMILVGIGGCWGLRTGPRPARMPWPRRRRGSPPPGSREPAAVPDGMRVAEGGSAAASGLSGAEGAPQPRRRTARSATTYPRQSGGANDPSGRASSPKAWLFVIAAACAVLTLWQLVYPLELQNEAVAPWLGEMDFRKINTVTNVMLFVPWGVAGVCLARVLGLGRAVAVLIVTLDGTLISLIGETIQVFQVDRSSSAADVVSNTMGAALGSWFGLAIGPGLVGPAAWLRDWLARSRSGRTMLVVLLVVLIVRTWPCHLSMEVPHLKQEWRRSVQAGPPFASLGAWWTRTRGAPLRSRAAAREVGAAATTMVLMGALTVAMWRSLRDGKARPGPGAAGTVLLCAVVIVLGTELLQWPIPNRVMDATEAAAGCGGVVLAAGVWIVRDLMRHRGAFDHG